MDGWTALIYSPHAPISQCYHICIISCSIYADKMQFHTSVSPSVVLQLIPSSLLNTLVAGRSQTGVIVLKEKDASLHST